jgi:hypothetical protein
MMEKGLQPLAGPFASAEKGKRGLRKNGGKSHRKKKENCLCQENAEREEKRKREKERNTGCVERERERERE